MMVKYLTTSLNLLHFLVGTKQLLLRIDPHRSKIREKSRITKNKSVTPQAYLKFQQGYLPASQL